ncbi:hypothetical protein OUZ56_031891 [Daphnia magna]|uniref:Uncharacterized protein n=1 Tax=Daphnia magna TaxID=35525 RepID=A0ABQ9ZVW2_9CRUS|nr:hypothetical protein OUZ56_031891 [Daphnia magna]
METNISGFVCCLVAALLFANTWKGDFVYDDRWFPIFRVFSMNTQLIFTWRNRMGGVCVDPPDAPGAVLNLNPTSSSWGGVSKQQQKKITN